MGVLTKRHLASAHDHVLFVALRACRDSLGAAAGEQRASQQRAAVVVSPFHPSRAAVTGQVRGMSRMRPGRLPPAGKLCAARKFGSFYASFVFLPCKAFPTCGIYRFRPMPRDSDDTPRAWAIRDHPGRWARQFAGGPARRLR